MTFPYVDEKVDHVNVRYLRRLSADAVRNLERTLVIKQKDKPVAVLLTYEQFLAMQRALCSAGAKVKEIA